MKGYNGVMKEKKLEALWDWKEEKRKNLLDI
jgi:hypothetical protein